MCSIALYSKRLIWQNSVNYIINLCGEKESKIVLTVQYVVAFVVSITVYLLMYIRIASVLFCPCVSNNNFMFFITLNTYILHVWYELLHMYLFNTSLFLCIHFCSLLLNNYIVHRLQCNVYINVLTLYISCMVHYNLLGFNYYNYWLLLFQC